MPKSSTPGHEHGAAAAVQLAELASSGTCPRNSTSGGARARRRASSGPVPTIAQAASRCRGRRRARARGACRGRGPRPRGRRRPGRSSPGVKKSVSTGGGMTLGLPAVVAPDAAGHVGAVGDEAVDPGGGARRPRRAAAPRRGRIARRASGRDAARAEVVVVAVPDVAHRRVAVAEVERARAAGARPWPRSGSSRAPGRSRARSNDSAAAREERQVVAVAACATPGRRWTKEVRMSRASSSGATEPAHVQQGEDRGVGEEAGQREEHLLAPAHPGEPVVDEGDLQRVASASGGARAGRAPSCSRRGWRGPSAPS